MAKERKRRRRTRTSNYRRHRRNRNPNPMFARSRIRHYRRRRNPGVGGTVSEIGGLILWGTSGAIASRALPQLLLTTNNTGVIGYLSNLLVAVVGGALVGRFAKGNSGSRFTAGGVIATGLRIFGDYFGTQAQQFGLSGDPAFAGLGYYIPNSFPLPTTGQGPYLLNPGQTGYPMAAGGVPTAMPAAAIVPAAGAQTAAGAAGGAMDMSEPTRWASRYAA